MVAAIGGNERGQESGARSAAGPRPRFGDDVEAGSKGTPKKKGQPHANLAGTGPGYLEQDLIPSEVPQQADFCGF